MLDRLRRLGCALADWCSLQMGTISIWLRAPIETPVDRAIREEGACARRFRRSTSTIRGRDALGLATLAGDHEIDTRAPAARAHKASVPVDDSRFGAVASRRRGGVGIDLMAAISAPSPPSWHCRPSSAVRCRRSSSPPTFMRGRRVVGFQRWRSSCRRFGGSPRSPVGASTAATVGRRRHRSCVGADGKGRQPLGP